MASKGVDVDLVDLLGCDASLDDASSRLVGFPDDQSSGSHFFDFAGGSQFAFDIGIHTMCGDWEVFQWGDHDRIEVEIQ